MKVESTSSCDGQVVECVENASAHVSVHMKEKDESVRNEKGSEGA